MIRTPLILLLVGALTSSLALAQASTQPTPDQKALLASDNPDLAANKQLVYDFWREVFEGGHLERADRYLAASYIQHNPNVPSGRAGFVRFFANFSTPKPIEDEIQAPLVSIVAERDLVVLSFAKDMPDPENTGQSYTTTWFDMFRIKDGKIVEHWDPAVKQ